jgi:hypothetical protein
VDGNLLAVPNANQLLDPWLDHVVERYSAAPRPRGAVSLAGRAPALHARGRSSSPTPPIANRMARPIWLSYAVRVSRRVREIASPAYLRDSLALRAGRRRAATRSRRSSAAKMRALHRGHENGDHPELAKSLRIEERELEAVG